MSNECNVINVINCLIAKTNKINKRIDDYSWTIETSDTINGPITSGPLKIKNKDKVKFIGDISVKKGSVIVDFTKLSNNSTKLSNNSTKLSNNSTNITYFTGANEVKSISEPGLVFLEGINGQYTINSGECKDGDIINILKSKNQEGWQPIIPGVADTFGQVSFIVKDGDTLYIGKKWKQDVAAAKPAAVLKEVAYYVEADKAADAAKEAIADLTDLAKAAYDKAAFEAGGETANYAAVEAAYNAWIEAEAGYNALGKVATDTKAAFETAKAGDEATAYAYTKTEADKAKATAAIARS